MGVRIHVEPVLAREPHVAACTVTDALVASAPRQRGTIVGWVAASDEPGRSPAAWTARGVAEALGPRARLAAFGPTTRAAIPLDADDGPHVRLSRPALGAPLTVRESWIGARLVLVAPCDDATAGDRGPAAAAFAAFAHGLGGPRLRDPVGLGQRWAAAVFCHVAVVLDASWWRGEDAGRPVLHPLDRCLGFVAAQPGRDAADPVDRVAAVDQWIAAATGRASRRPLGVEPQGTGAHLAWPAVPGSGARPTARWADTTVPALWTPRPVPRRPHPRLPGPLGRVWDDYDAEGSS
jgi:hypothetical protein